jgi:hypothetical protein
MVDWEQLPSIQLIYMMVSFNKAYKMKINVILQIRSLVKSGE